MEKSIEGRNINKFGKSSDSEELKVAVSFKKKYRIL